ncbi:PaaI family thioesterase [Chenggangzhangella methanolivorans]|uniref:PaaI family thioesterase n=1 Tax=Chenggangzhangella methanolivorans TaxID=1437009 RepID=A0A9E6RCI5_9HYPH|nr:PaaI family thioesterase [Chenggangzhangella methanolivorans]QZO00789.1 PaaI family thioesterase [Chenggangzhangella methanolivorans]
MNDAPSPAFDPLGEGWEVFDGQGFVDHVGPFYVRTGADGLRSFGFVAEPKHANLIGVVHGGMLMTLADRALGVAAWDAAGGKPSVTVQFDMQFLSAVKMGEFASMQPELVRLTRSLVFMRGTLMVGDRAAAAANGLWKILDRAA